MSKKKMFAILLTLVGIVFLTDELWMFGFPIGHILPDLSEYHIALFGFQYHHWMTGVILIILAIMIWRHDDGK
nr:MAG: hypothetical protein AM325_02605 [Candidatus Thorarchaeota archaeon SMTZ1-45]